MRDSIVALILAGSFFKAQDQFGTIRGTVVIIESDGSTSMIPGAAVVIDGRELFRTTTADDKGSWFFELPAGRYQIRANAPGLMGSASAVLDPEQSLDVQIVMSVESAKQSVTVTGSDGLRSRWKRDQQFTDNKLFIS